MSIRFRDPRALIRRLFRLDTFSFKGVGPALVIGSLALFGFFVISPTQYSNVELPVTSPSAERGANWSETANPGERAAETRHIPFAVRGMEDQGEAADISDPAKASRARERVGMNIFLRSGYLEGACKMVDGALGQVAQPRYKAVVSQEIFACAASESDMDTGEEPTDRPDTDAGGILADRLVEAHFLAIAAVAVEKFHRGPLQRRIEWIYSHIYSVIFGHYPDISLGPAQIRISSIQRAARNRTSSPANFRVPSSETAIAAALANECKALGLAAFLMFESLAKAEQACAADLDGDCAARSAASAYVGNKRKTHAVIDYAPVVVQMRWMASSEIECRPYR